MNIPSTVLAAVLLLLGVSGCDPFKLHEPTPEQRARWAEESKRVHKRGRMAFEAGVPANANPYVGTRYETGNAIMWLDGYIEAKTAAEAKQ